MNCACYTSVCLVHTVVVMVTCMSQSCECVLYESVFVFFLMMRRPPRSTQRRSSAASDVYKRQEISGGLPGKRGSANAYLPVKRRIKTRRVMSVSYTHLRAHETVLDLVCRLPLDKNKPQQHNTNKYVILVNLRKTHLAHSMTHLIIHHTQQLSKSYN